MPTARKDIIRDGEEGVYHCFARCVRRAFLCGQDPYTGQNFDHRKVWILERLQWLLSLFAIETTCPQCLDKSDLGPGWAPCEGFLSYARLTASPIQPLRPSFSAA